MSERDGTQRPPRPPRRPALVLLALSIATMLATAVVTLRLTGDHTAPATAPRSQAPATGGSSVEGRPNTPDYSGGLGADPQERSTRSAAVRALLERRSSAVLHRDRAAFLGTVDPRGGAFRTRQAQLFDNLAEVPLSFWSYKINPGVEHPVADAGFARYDAPVWSPDVALVYALRGVDPVPTERPQYLTFVRRGGQWFLGSDDDFTTQGHTSWRGLWDFGPVVARRGESSLILAHPRHAARLAGFANAVDDAVPAVTKVWGPQWSQQVAVLIPETQQEMSEVIGGQFALSHIAAVATADYTDARRQLARGQRVVINPANLDRLGRLARDVVLRHEITHVASRSVTGVHTPTWLMEGFADYVGYLNSGVAVTTAAQELRTEVRDGKVPADLPANDEFKGDNARLSQAYEAAWMACRLVAERAGQDGLVRFYRAVGGSEGDPRAAVDRALRAELHLSYQQFVAEWKASLVRELS